MSDRKLVVLTAQSWFDATRDSSYSMGERLLFMENALNHTENALVAARDEATDLHAKLEAAEKDRDYFQKDYIEQSKRAGQAEQERDNLQAANGVLRGAVSGLMDVIEAHQWECWQYEDALKAIKTTPAEAGERVRNVVIALDRCLQFIEELKRHGITNWSGEQGVKDALAKFRGGNKNG